MADLLVLTSTIAALSLRLCFELLDLLKLSAHCVEENEIILGMNLPEYLLVPPAAMPDESMVITGGKWRIQVLTSRLMRIEWSPSGVFEDRPTQMIINRSFTPVEEVKIQRSTDDAGIERVTVTTPAMSLHYDGQEFTSHGLYATAIMPEQWGAEWRWGISDERPWIKGQNLRGTCRTLDDVDGRVELDNGILDGRGITAVEDTTAPIQDSWPTAREKGSHDVYIFAYGWNFRAAVADYYRLTGAQPILPRYALGNWWSRYHRYSADEYLQLMQGFSEHQIPLSVAVIDMDWHLVDVPEKYGSGWTGFTWNRELFPDPEGFLNTLKKRGLATMLNLHPADGVRAFEEPYPDLATAMGVDPASEETIAFAPDSAQFMTAYMRHVLEPMEAQGVDAWWVDWQQGAFSRTQGLDPLWLLNHVHVLHNAAQNGGRGLTLSRYAGPGSHRYPVGFSGDTIVSWESLKFQPEFTATASNIGYGWWSHDIGGHMNGVNDRELQTRWVQLGVFSPIMRLHSSNNPLMSKEPWRWGVRESAIQAEFMRLRHRLVPYLHSEQCWGHQNLAPLVEPMYWETPESDGAWNVPYQYRFGRQLVVAPLTDPEDDASGLARVDVFLPPGKWVDLLTGHVYRGGRTMAMYRPLEYLPVLASEGAIVPLAGHCAHDEASLLSLGAECVLGAERALSPMTDTEHPVDIEVVIVAGSDGGYELVEDDGCDGGVSSRTLLIWNDRERCLTVKAAVVAGLNEGNEALVPPKRRWKVRLFDGDGGVHTTLTGELATCEEHRIFIHHTEQKDDPQAGAWIWQIAERAQIDNDLRAAVASLGWWHDRAYALSEVQRLPLNEFVRGAVIEALTA